MATNRSHVKAAYDTLFAKAEAAKSAIEDKEVQTDADDNRIQAYEQFLEAIESAIDELESELDSAN